jgi:imidazolonepropionase-like amidohydrolase
LRALLSVLALLFASGCGDGAPDAPRDAATAPPGKLLIEGVTVVDTRDGRLAPGMSILMSDGVIVRVEPTGTLAVEPPFERIDATGKFAVPGFLDMHAHALGDEHEAHDLALMLANGITGFRQMMASEALLERRREGTLALGPDTPELLAMPGFGLTPFNARNPEVAVEEVRAQKEAGADFIKIGLTSPEALFAVLDEGRRLGLPVVGHVPPDVDVREASRRGMRSIEHLGPAHGILLACSADEAELRAHGPKVPALLTSPPFTPPFAEQLAAFLLRKRIQNPQLGTPPEEYARLRRIVDSYDEEKCRGVAAQFVADGTWQVPTLIRARTSQLAFLPEIQNDPSVRFAPRETVASWREVTDEFEAQLSEESRATLRAAYERQLELVRLLDAAGVRMLAGSDSTGAAWTVPGFALHREFDELAKAGLSPLRVLQMTTLYAAEFLGRSDALGSVEPGKVADLVLLDANPLESVANLHAIHAVVRANRYHARSF